ncbi:MAG: 50S ribosomal protein L4 [Candidatus Hydrothermarchaeales archaeon]
MTKLKVYSLKGKAKAKETVDLPEVFNEKVRLDLIKRAVLASQSARYQPQGVNWYAGKRTSAKSWGPGSGHARVPRVKGTRHPAGGRGAIAPMAVGGRSAHPPVPFKKIIKKINKKERKMALASAIAATALTELIERRGHVVDKLPQLPLVVTDELEELETAAETRDAFIKLGLWGDLDRAKNRKIRAGKGTMRGRKYKQRKSVLIVVANDRGISHGACNHPGVDVVTVDSLGVEDLAPGTHPGRLTIYTKSALQRLDERYIHSSTIREKKTKSK